MMGINFIVPMTAFDKLWESGSVHQAKEKGALRLEGKVYVVQDGEEALAEGVIRLIQDPDLAGSLGIAARVTVEGRFQWAHVVREIERCYDHLASHMPELGLLDEQLAHAGGGK